MTSRRCWLSDRRLTTKDATASNRGSGPFLGCDNSGTYIVSDPWRHAQNREMRPTNAIKLKMHLTPSDGVVRNQGFPDHGFPTAWAPLHRKVVMWPVSRPRSSPHTMSTLFSKKHHVTMKRLNCSDRHSCNS